MANVCYNTPMESVEVKAYAKINLTLYILGVEKGYHMLDSLVASVDLYDKIILKKRSDRRICLTMHGLGSEDIPPESNNAVRAGKLFVERFQSGGADIEIYKNIPMGAGLGGSSADSAGVLNGLAKLYEIDDVASIKQIADMTGSDTRYMLSGGWARLFGRGDRVKEIDGKLGAHIALLVPDESVSTAKCYSLFDEAGKVGGNSDDAEQAVKRGDIKGLAGCLCNALTGPATSLSGEIQRCIDELKNSAPLAVNMTGSGSGVYALFENKQECINALSRYKGKARAYILEVI